MSLKVDLHCHTQESDGSLTCEALIHRAVEQGVDLLAITDHDTTAVHPQAAEIAQDLDIEIVPGVEISCAIDNQELHIVGLGIDINNQPLQELLAQNREARKIRAEKILHKFQKSGLDDLTEQLNQLVKGQVVCRSHLAQLLYSEGVVKDFQKAFNKYLAKKAKAWVPVKWQEMSLIVSRINDAGGVAVLAHPSKYKISPNRLGLIIQAFAEAGGKAVEIAYPGLNPSERARLIRQVELQQLCVSQGSDFHRPGNSWTELGAFGVNPASFKAVWQHFDLIKACH